MATFTADYEAMENTAKKLEKNADEFSAICRQLTGVATGMGKAYDSADNREFTVQIEACAKDLSKMIQHLYNASVILSKQAEGYRKAEEHNMGQAKRLHN